tara:strand:- start:1464 stop:1901 length:438 start_codon:yes stop_codon:yes gene_type:complete
MIAVIIVTDRKMFVWALTLIVKARRKKMDKDAEEFWKEWVTDLKDELDTYKKLAKERGELNVKLAHQLERMVDKPRNSRAVSSPLEWVPPTKSDEELNALKEEDKSMWICTACDKSTYETEYDYLASRTLHLECALKEEMKNDPL